MEQKGEISTGIYRHYKGNIYEVVANACHSETLEKMVVYRSISAEKTWVRPASMWHEIVEHDGKRVPRFQFIATSLDDMDGKQLFKTIEDIVCIYEKYDHNSENGILAFCHCETGEVIELTEDIGSYMDGDISEEELPSCDIVKLTQVKDIEQNPKAYIRLPYDGLWDEYEIMSDFASLLPYPYSDKLDDALGGKGVFRRFKDTIARLNLKEQWYAYRDSRIRQETREWCEAVGVRWEKSYINP